MIDDKIAQAKKDIELLQKNIEDLEKQKRDQEYFRRGQWFKISHRIPGIPDEVFGRICQLVQVEGCSYCLINALNGNRYENPIEFPNHLVSREDLKKLSPWVGEYLEPIQVAIIEKEIM